MTWRTPVLNMLMNGFTHLGGVIGMSIIAGLLTLAMTWRWRSPTPLVLMAIAVAGSLTFTTVGKAIVGRQRPPLSDAIPPYEYAFSFPSGHTLNSTVIAGVVACLVCQHVRTRLARLLSISAAISWAAAIGISRVYLGHHWLTDVVFGWLLGLAWLGFLVTAHRIFLAMRTMRQAGPRSTASTPPGASATAASWRNSGAALGQPRRQTVTKRESS